MHKVQAARGAPVTPTKSAARLKLGITALVVIAADQLTKSIAVEALGDGRRIPLIGDVLGLRLVLNSGSAFGLFQGLTFALFLISSSILILVLVWGLREPEFPILLGMVVGGGAGNLVDRLIRPPSPMRGSVVDFIDLSFWPTFNLADSAIVVGVILLFILLIKQGDPANRAVAADDPPA